MSKICSYCGRLGKTKPGTYLTLEHVTPEFMVCADNDSRKMVYFEKSLIIPSPAKIKDVCNLCNNEVLSKLDSYGKTLFDSFFNENITYISKVFTYDYDQLSRWLLKISYNNHRIANRSEALNIYTDEIIEYIIGQKDSLEGLCLYGNIIPSQETKKLPYAKDVLGNEKYLRPPKLRIANIKLPNRVTPRISRIVAINNYYFYIFYPVNGNEIVDSLPRSYTILNDAERVILRKDKKTYLESMEETFEKFPDVFRNNPVI